jgi:hypothetical protein
MSNSIKLRAFFSLVTVPNARIQSPVSPLIWGRQRMVCGDPARRAAVWRWTEFKERDTPHFGWLCHVATKSCSSVSPLGMVFIPIPAGVSTVSVRDRKADVSAVLFVIQPRIVNMNRLVHGSLPSFVDE